MEVGDAITCSEDGEQCRILLGVGVLGIHQLKVELKSPTALVSSQLYPQLVSWDSTIMPGETT